MRVRSCGLRVLALLVLPLVQLLVMPGQPGLPVAFGADPRQRDLPKSQPRPRLLPRPVEKPEQSAPAVTEPAVAQPARGGPDTEEMVQIPAGSFQMGTNHGEGNEKPVHTVYVDAFWMERHEATNRRYGRFMQATGHPAPGYWTDSRFNQPEQPVVGVSWDDAVAFCRWAGKRLPTEAEWEKAARGGRSQGEYPWGDGSPQGMACYGLDLYTGGPMAVGSYSPNGYGLYGMAGNVWEWCADWYREGFYGVSPSQNPRGPPYGLGRVVRGGAWYFDGFRMRCSFREIYAPACRLSGLGFRCVR